MEPSIYQVPALKQYVSSKRWSEIIKQSITSFDYAYKLEAVRDWLFAQSKQSAPLLALLLTCLSCTHCFLINGSAPTIDIEPKKLLRYMHRI